MYIWMMVTRDKYELPLAIADTARELAELTGLHKTSIMKGALSYEAGSKCSRFRKVRVDKNEDEGQDK